MGITSYKYPKHFLLITVLRLDLKFSGFPSKNIRRLTMMDWKRTLRELLLLFINLRHWFFQRKIFRV